MIKANKRILSILGIAFVLAAVIFAALFAGGSKKVKADGVIKSEQVYHIEIDVTGLSEAYAGISLFGWVGTAKNARIPDGSVLKYDFYSPNVLSGIGGLTALRDATTSNVLDDWSAWDISLYDITDTKGYGAQSDTDLSKVTGNGWYSRSVELGNVPNGGGVAQWLAVVDTPDLKGYDKIDLYYKNARVVAPDGKELFNIFFSSQNGLEIPPVTSTEWAPLRQDCNLSTARVSGGYLNSALKLSKLRKTADFILTNASTDLSGLITGADIVRIKCYGADGNEIRLSGFRFTPFLAGKYRLVFSANITEGDKVFPYCYETNITAVDNRTATFVTDDALENTDSYYSAGTDKINFPINYGYVGGVKTKAAFEVKNVLGEYVKVEKSEQGFSVDATDGQFLAAYYVESGGVKSYCPTFIYCVGRPELNLSCFKTNGKLGYTYSLSSFYNGLKEGTELTEINITMPSGEPVTIVDREFLPLQAGEYLVELNVKQPKYGPEEQKKSTTLIVNSDDGMIIKVDIAVPKQFCGEGISKQAVIRLFTFNAFSGLSENDTFSYDIYMPAPMCGVGLVSFMGDGSPSVNGGVEGVWNYLPENYNWNNPLPTDKNDIRLYGDNDLTPYLSKDGKLCWYTRNIQLNSYWALPVYDYACEIKTTDAITVANNADYGLITFYLKNLKFTKQDGSVTNIFSGAEKLLRPQVYSQYLEGHPKSGTWLTEGVGRYSASITYDLAPMLNKQALPKNNNISIGESVRLKDELLYDFNRRESAKEVSFAVTSPEGKALSLKDNSFVPLTTGKYKVNVSGRSVGGELVDTEFFLFANDALKPEITALKSPEIKMKDTVDLYSFFTVNDNGSAVPDVKLRLKNANNFIYDIAKDGLFTFEYCGEYVLEITALDSSMNEARIEIAFNVQAPDSGGLSGAALTAAIVIPPVTAAAIVSVVLVFVFKKRGKHVE